MTSARMDAASGRPDPSLLDAAEVVAALGSDAEAGLSGPEAARRLVSLGPNELTTTPPTPRWRTFLAQLHDPLITLLLVAIAVSALAWVVEGRHGAPVDAIVIAAIVLLNAVLGTAEQAKADDAVAALARMSATSATVVRDGVQRRVATRELVPGDVLVLAEGDKVAADARLLHAAALAVTEASLTGESESVLKDARTLPGPAALGDRLDMVFNGTSVVRGSGRAVVTGTGMSTQMGVIAGLLDTTVEDPTPLQHEIARVGRALGIAVVVIAIVVVATVLAVSGARSVESVVTALLLGVSLAVAAVPEGLPTILAVVLSLGVQRMAVHRAVVTSLSSVETLGSASVVCSDKTGTLTQGEMTIARVVVSSGEVVVTGAGYRPEGELLLGGLALAPGSAALLETATVLGGGSLANDARLLETDGVWSVQGDPTEAAFMVAEVKLGTREDRRARFHRVGIVPFTSERRLMTSIEADAERDGRLAVVTKGAPEVVLGRCTHALVDGATQELDEARRAQVMADVARLSAEGYRTLAVAYRPLDVTTVQEVGPHLEHALVHAGLVGIVDPARPEAATAIRQAHGAGIRVVMITGDHPLTASRIAQDLGIRDREPVAVTGAELDRLDEPGFREIVRHRSVFARVTPEQKLRIVDALQADGQVVAMTGDGVNDAPALKSADIGVAMGLAGTQVTKDAANMILADDNFATIIRAVREGRGILLNIKKFLRYLLSSNLGEVLTVFLGVVLASVIGLTRPDGALVLPLLATQILWINLLTDSGPALAMGVDPESEDVMSRPPRALGARVIDARMWGGVLVVGLVMALVTLAMIDLSLPGGLLPGSGDLDTARTAGFTVLVLAQLFNALSSRSETVSAFHRIGANRWLWAAIGLSLLLQVAVVHVPLLAAAFGTTPLTGGQWLTCLAMASAVLWAAELRKLALRLVDRRRAGQTVPPAPRSVSLGCA